MPYETKTYQELIELEKASIRNRIPEADTSDGSDYDIEARVHATVVHGNQAQGTYLAKQVIPSTAEGDMLIEHGNRVGVGRLAAGIASGVVALVLDSGTSGTQASGSALRSANGIEYTTDEAGSISLPSWTGKTVGQGSSTTRIAVLPNVSGMNPGERIEVTIDGVAEEYTIKRVLPSIQTVEIYGTLSGIPATSSAINPIYSAMVEVTANDSGSIANRSANEAGTLDSPSGTISATCYFLEMTGGSEVQSIDDFRRDVVSAHASQPGSGNLEHWRRWTIETPNVGMANAFIYPNLRGLGAMTVVPFGVAGARRIGDERNGEILSHVRSQCGAFDDVEVGPLSPMGRDEDLVLVIEPGVGYEPDWIEPSGGVKVRSTFPTSTTTVLQLTNEEHLDLFQIGDRIVVPIYINGQYTTEQVTVAAIVNAGFNDHQIHLNETLSAVPADDDPGGPFITPGGPLYQTLRDALDAFFDTLGPGDTVPPSRWPRPQDEFPAKLTTANISCVALGVDGVVNVVVSEPAEDKVPLPLHYFKLGRLVIVWA